MPAAPSQLDLFGEPSAARAPATPAPTEVSHGVARVFLDWSAPALPAVAAWLVDRASAEGAIDLRSTIVALPTSRAARRLLELLVARAEASGRPLFPPRLVTAGALPDLLAPSPQPVAGAPTRRVVWAEALREADAETRALIVARPPPLEDWAAWAALGGVLDDLHAELAKADLTFEGVAALGVTLDEFPDEARWLAMERVAELYATRLATLGLADPQRARTTSVADALARPLEHAGTAPPLAIVLACVPDLSPATRRLLDRSRATGGACVTALVFAPESLAERFDAHGCIIAAAWTDAPLPIADDALVVADGPDDQAARVIALLAELGSSAGGVNLAAEDVVVGAPDAEVVPFLIERLEDAGLPGRDAAGVPAQRTAPARFLATAAAWVTHGDFASLAALVRHADVEQRLGAERDLASQLDEYNARHVQRRLTDAAGLPTLRGDEREIARITVVIHSVETLVLPLRGGPRPLAAWAEALAGALLALYGGRRLHPTEDDDHLVSGGISAIREVLRELHALGAAGAPGSEDAGRLLAQGVDAASATRIVLDAIADAAVPPSAEDAAIEVLGWLELPLDDAPALIVTGFVEGRLPGSVNADPFLPDRLRRHLGLDDNARRHARDAYALQAVLASRPYVRLLAGRRDASGTPLVPSRLALTGEADTVARRLLAFYRGDGTSRLVLLSRRLAPGRTESAITVPRPPVVATTALTKLRVTAFGDYLACPYRFWLQHVLGLRPLRDDAVELDARLFGSLAHEVLRDFGVSDCAASNTEGEIAQFLEGALDARVEAHFGETAFPAVRVQVAQLRERLRAFAREQARWAESGKRIVAVEVGASDASSAGASFVVDGEPFLLSGRIDRIDRDERTGALYVLDYKLSETARAPEEAHRKQGAWIDLQLPLYVHILRAREESLTGTAVHLGYVCLPRDVRATQFALADWSRAELDEADEVAAGVVRAVRSGTFWPPTSPPPIFSDAYADVCQDSRLGAPPTLDDDESGATSDGQVADGGAA
jgi:hypothetical protein